MHDEEVKDYKGGYQNTELGLLSQVYYIFETKILSFCPYVYFCLNCLYCLTWFIQKQFYAIKIVGFLQHFITTVTIMCSRNPPFVLYLI